MIPASTLAIESVMGEEERDLIRARVTPHWWTVADTLDIGEENNWYREEIAAAWEAWGEDLARVLGVICEGLSDESLARLVKLSMMALVLAYGTPPTEDVVRNLAGRAAERMVMLTEV